jgi:hypothetical protein
MLSGWKDLTGSVRWTETVGLCVSSFSLLSLLFRSVFESSVAFVLFLLFRLRAARSFVVVFLILIRP